MSKLIIVIFILSNLNLGLAQCEFTDGSNSIHTQTELNLFFEKNIDCTSLLGLTLLGEGSQEIDPIVDLSPISRSNLREIKFLQIWGWKSLTTLKGLEKLNHIGRIILRDLEGLEDISALENIEIEKFVFDFNEHIIDLSQFEDINLRWLSLRGDGLLSGAIFTNPTFILEVHENNTPNNFEGLLSNDIDSLSIVLQRCSNFSLHGLDIFEDIYELGIAACDSISFIGVQNLKSVQNLTLGFSKPTDEFEVTNFEKLENINGSLIITKQNNLRKLEDLFPALSKIGSRLRLLNNEDLYDISLLNNFEIPQGTFEYLGSHSYFRADDDYRIWFKGNPELDNCYSPFLCRALNTYPDQVFLENNGTESCIYSVLLNVCSTVANENLSENLTLEIYPNPVSHELFIQSNLEGTFKARVNIFDLSGRLELTQKFSNSIDVSSLPEGVHFLDVITNENAYQTLRFVKM